MCFTMPSVVICIFVYACVRSLEAGVTGGCELSAHGSWEQNLNRQEEKQVLLVVEPSFKKGLKLGGGGARL